MPRRIHNDVAKMSKKLVNIRVSMLDADLDFPVQVVCRSSPYALFLGSYRFRWCCTLISFDLILAQYSARKKSSREVHCNIEALEAKTIFLYLQFLAKTNESWPFVIYVINNYVSSDFFTMVHQVHVRDIRRTIHGVTPIFLGYFYFVCQCKFQYIGLCWKQCLVL